MSEIYYHAGLPKTASTYLQNIVFPYLEGIQYFRKSKLKAYLSLQPEPGKKYLFSREADIILKQRLRDFHACHPQAKIILVLRRQDKWLTSKYKYYIRKHGWKSFREYFDVVNDQGILPQKEAYFKPRIDFIEDLFKSKPLILFHEDLKKDAKSFIKKFTDYTGTAFIPKKRLDKVIKPKFSPKQLNVLLKYNKFYKYNDTNFRSQTRKRIYKKFSEYLLHMVAFSSKIIPDSMIKKHELIPQDDLIQIREFYKADWEACLEYANQRLSV